jgi:uncharacterized protein RhaS with RHS repeats
MFSPYQGRFVTLDPTGFTAGDVNEYRGESNNPVNRLDPSGLATVPKEIRTFTLPDYLKVYADYKSDYATYMTKFDEAAITHNAIKNMNSARAGLLLDSAYNQICRNKSKSDDINNQILELDKSIAIAEKNLATMQFSLFTDKLGLSQSYTRLKNQWNELQNDDDLKDRNYPFEIVLPPSVDADGYDKRIQEILRDIKNNIYDK